MMYEHGAVLYLQYLMSDLLDHLDSISSTQDPYSNKQWNQPSHHDYLKQDLYGPLKHIYNRKTYYGEQSRTLCVINYYFDTIDSHSYDNPQVCIYCNGEHHILFDTDHFKEELKSNRCDPWEHKQHYCFGSSYEKQHISFDTDHFKEKVKSN